MSLESAVSALATRIAAEVNSLRDTLVPTAGGTMTGKLLITEGSTSLLPGAVTGGPYLTVPTGWDDDLQIKLAASKAGSGLTRACAVGASIMQGYGASTLQGGFVNLWRDYMQSIYGDGGSGVIGVWNGPASTTGVSGNPMFPMTWSAGWTPIAGGQGWLVHSETTGNTLTWTLRGKHVRVWFVRNSIFGSFTTTIDGVNMGTTSTTGAAAMGSVQYDLATSGPHTVTVTVATPASGVYLTSAEAWNDTGFVLDNWAVWGTVAATINQLIGNGYPAGESAGKWTILQPHPIDLLINSYGGNDQAAQTDIPTLVALLDEASIYARQNNPLVATLGMQFPNTPDTSNNYYTYSQAVQAFYRSIGAAYFDGFGLFRGSNLYSTAKGWTLANNPHPIDAGQQVLLTHLEPLGTLVP